MKIDPTPAASAEQSIRSIYKAAKEHIEPMSKAFLLAIADVRFPAPGSATIYAELDPRDGQCRYIGSTSVDPIRRLAFKMLDIKDEGSAHTMWVRELKSQGWIPVTVPISFAPKHVKGKINDSLMALLEAYYIHSLKGRYQLLNVNDPRTGDVLIDCDAPSLAKQFRVRILESNP